MTLITVSGVGERHLRAERSTLTGRISIADADRKRSIRRGTEAHAAVAAHVARLRESGSATWHSVDALSTWVRTWTDQSGGTHTDHVTGGSVQVKLQRLDEVSDVVAALSALGATVSTDWSLTVATRDRVTRELRHAAVQDAREKAGDFAAALGVEVASVQEIQESTGYGAVAMRASAGDSELTIPEITVRVDVTGRFQTA